MMFLHLAHCGGIRISHDRMVCDWLVVYVDGKYEKSTVRIKVLYHSSKLAVPLLCEPDPQCKRQAGTPTIVHVHNAHNIYR